MSILGMTKNPWLLPVSPAAITVLAAIASHAPAQADPLPPWCGLPDPLEVCVGLPAATT